MIVASTRILLVLILYCSAVSGVVVGDDEVLVYSC